MRNTKILMVEDESDVLAINKEFLEGQGFDTCSAATIAAARGLLDEAPDLVLLDVMLPDGMGWDFAEEIRAKTSAPIIYLTCRDENESVLEGFTKGGDDYVVKPYDMKVLAARIHSVLNRAGLTSSEIIKVPPLYINRLSNTAEIAGRRVNLAPREIQLLICLAKQAGRYVKCEDIYRQVWGELVDGYERTISVYASYLRKKLMLSVDGLFEIRCTDNQEYILSKLVY